jgi:hypothetical protein
VTRAGLSAREDRFGDVGCQEGIANQSHEIVRCHARFAHQIAGRVSFAAQKSLRPLFPARHGLDERKRPANHTYREPVVI